MRQLVAMGHLQPDAGAFGALKLTETARGVLKGETDVMLREETPGPALAPAGANQGAAISRRRAAAARPAIRRWSARCARGAPRWRASAACRPMSCCTIPTIDGIATSRPTTLTQLRDIPGIGDKKLEHYGDELIALVKAHRTEA